MRTHRHWPAAIVLTAALLAGCTSNPAPSVTASPTATGASPSITATPDASGTPTASPTAAPTSPAPATCEPFGETGATASSPDWSSELRGGPGQELWGVTMRLGTHECYDRWVLEFAGGAPMPGWSVTPHASGVFARDASGEDLTPPLTGSASLEVMVGAWYDGTAIGAAPYAGPVDLAGIGEGIVEARIVGAFEGITQVGLGLDRARPYRVAWLEDPGRLVIDVFTG